MRTIVFFVFALSGCSGPGLTEAQQSEAAQIASVIAEDRVSDAEDEIEDATDMAYDHEERIAAIEERLGIE